MHNQSSLDEYIKKEPAYCNNLQENQNKKATISPAITEKTLQRKLWYVEIFTSSQSPICLVDKIKINGSLSTKRCKSLMGV